MKRIRTHITYANVAATIAVVFAMSGTALAAHHYLINSTSQISPKVLRKLKGSKGRAGVAGARGVQGGPGPAGERGQTGVQGGAGARGPSDVYEVQLDEEGPVVAAGQHQTLTLAELPPGSYVISGKGVIAPSEHVTSTSFCELSAQTDTDFGRQVLSTSVNYVVTVDTELAHTFSSTGSVTMTCAASNDTWVFDEQSRIVAIAVADQHRTSVGFG